MSEFYSIIQSPYITEKATMAGQNRQYTFRVSGDANKIEIKKAVEKIYKVKVTRVNVLNKKGKLKRLRWGQEGKTASWKKAVVTLREGQEIKFV
ncbi:MAG: 50S ribosomal protein L23 [Candidatus Omnitrophica bacterium]|nr:50S ribosomal protein L23 [Candidatus Omnitrophota bacterium]